MAAFALIWVIAFVAVGILDAAWHLVLFKQDYAAGLRPLLPRKQDGKQGMRGTPAIISQVLVISAYVAIVGILYDHGATLWIGTLAGAVSGTLAISVYGLVNRGLIHDWNVRITVLEVIWGPIIGSLSGLLIYWLMSLLIS